MVVVDVNDNTPVFPERQVNISVSEGEDITINPQLLTVTATDADDSLNGDIRYELIGDEGMPINSLPTVTRYCNYHVDDRNNRK